MLLFTYIYKATTTKTINFCHSHSDGYNKLSACSSHPRFVSSSVSQIPIDKAAARNVTQVVFVSFGETMSQ